MNHNLLKEYLDIKKNKVSNSHEWASSSEKIINLSSLLQKFYLSDLNKIKNFDSIQECFNLSVENLNKGHSLTFKSNLIIQYKNEKELKNIKLLTPIQLSEVFNENWTTEEKLLIELFLAHPQTFIGVNLGLYLKKQEP